MQNGQCWDMLLPTSQILLRCLINKSHQNWATDNKSPRTEMSFRKEGAETGNVTPGSPNNGREAALGTGLGRRASTGLPTDPTGLVALTPLTVSQTHGAAPSVECNPAQARLPGASPVGECSLPSERGPRAKPHQSCPSCDPRGCSPTQAPLSLGFSSR